jgi:hypothetical protein
VKEANSCGLSLLLSAPPSCCSRRAMRHPHICDTTENSGRASGTCRLAGKTGTGHIGGMATYEYRVTEAADGTFPVELWRTGGGGQCIYRTRGFPTRELAEAWTVPVAVDVPADGPPSPPRSRVVYILMSSLHCETPGFGAGGLRWRCRLASSNVNKDRCSHAGTCVRRLTRIPVSVGRAQNDVVRPMSRECVAAFMGAA